jgi:hypothetical protein
MGDPDRLTVPGYGEIARESLYYLSDTLSRRGGQVRNSAPETVIAIGKM